MATVDSGRLYTDAYPGPPERLHLRHRKPRPGGSRCPPPVGSVVAGGGGPTRPDLAGARAGAGGGERFGRRHRAPERRSNGCGRFTATTRSTTRPIREGKALLAAIAAAHTSPVHVRNHFLLNTGDGTPAMKWGSTNVYTEDDAGNPVYDWTLTDGIMDAITGVGALPFLELGFMPEALSTHPVPYRNSSTLASTAAASIRPPTTRSGEL